MPRRHLQSESAFTLADVMMGSVILVVGFIAVVHAVSLGTVMLDTARKTQVAQQIIDAELENLRGNDWTYLSSTLPTSPTYVSVTVNADGTDTSDNNGGNGLSDRNYFILTNNASLLALAKNFTVRLDAYNVTGRANIRRVVVTVTWVTNTTSQTQTSSFDVRTSAVSQSHTCSGELYLAKNGLHLSFQKS
jgi:hypothetical protein